MNVDFTDFSNDKYILLKALHDNQTKVGNEKYVPFSQAEISEVVGFSRPKTNLLMKELISEGYVSLHNGVRGRYEVMETGRYVVKVFEKSRKGGSSRV